MDNAKIEWEKWRENGVQQREKKLLDLHPKELDTEQLSKKKKRRILKGIKRSLNRKGTFRYISTHIGKGDRNGLKRLHVMNDKNQIEKTYVSKEEIEQLIIQNNYKHFT